MFRLNVRQRLLPRASVVPGHVAPSQQTSSRARKSCSPAGELYSDLHGSDESADATRLAWDAATSFGENRVLLGLQAAYSHGGEGLLGVSSKAGGLANFSGYVQEEVIADQLGLARAIYYRRLNRGGLVFGVPVYAGASLEAGGFWGDVDEIDIDDRVIAGSAFVGFNTVLGPIFVGYGRAESGVDSVYLRFGPLLHSDLQL